MLKDYTYVNYISKWVILAQIDNNLQSKIGDAWTKFSICLSIFYLSIHPSINYLFIFYSGCNFFSSFEILYVGRILSSSMILSLSIFFLSPPCLTHLKKIWLLKVIDLPPSLHLIDFVTIIFRSIEKSKCFQIFGNQSQLKIKAIITF